LADKLRGMHGLDIVNRRNSSKQAGFRALVCDTSFNPQGSVLWSARFGRQHGNYKFYESNSRQGKSSHITAVLEERNNLLLLVRLS